MREIEIDKWAMIKEYYHQFKGKYSVLKTRDVISVFSRGGQNFDHFFRGGGQNMKKKIYRQKHK